MLGLVHSLGAVLPPVSLSPPSLKATFLWLANFWKPAEEQHSAVLCPHKKEMSNVPPLRAHCQAFFSKNKTAVHCCVINKTDLNYRFNKYNKNNCNISASPKDRVEIVIAHVVWKHDAGTILRRVMPRVIVIRNSSSLFNMKDDSLKSRPRNFTPKQWVNTQLQNKWKRTSGFEDPHPSFSQLYRTL